MDRPLPVLARIPRLNDSTEAVETAPGESAVSAELPKCNSRVLSQAAAFRLLIGIGVVLSLMAVSPNLFLGRSDSDTDGPTISNDQETTATANPQNDAWASMDDNQFIAETDSAVDENDIAPPAPPIPTDAPQPQMSMRPPAENFPIEVAERPGMSRLDGGINHETSYPPVSKPTSSYPTTRAPIVEPTPPVPAPMQYPSTDSGTIWAPGEAAPNRYPVVAPTNAGARFAPRPNVPSMGYTIPNDRPATGETPVNYIEYRDSRNTTAPVIYR